MKGNAGQPVGTSHDGPYCTALGVCVYLYSITTWTGAARRGGPTIMQSTQVRTVGRAAGIAPPNRFERVHWEVDYEQLAEAADLPDVRRLHTQFLPDKSRSLITQNDSPDVPFRYSINPYRGCEHGCATATLALATNCWG